MRSDVKNPRRPPKHPMARTKKSDSTDDTQDPVFWFVLFFAAVLIWMLVNYSAHGG